MLTISSVPNRFVGRIKERDLLFSCLSKTMIRNGTLVLITGEAGIGKSRLADEFLEKAMGTNCSCISGNCLPGMPLPYLPFIEAFNKAKVSESLPKMSGAGDRVKETKPIFGENYVCGDTESSHVIDATWSPDRILFTALEFVKARSRLRPLIIHIEDLQWADPQSVQLLHFLARNAKSEKILILGTYRTEEVLPLDGQTTNSLFDVLRLMRREGLVEEIELGGLENDDAAEIINDVLGCVANNEIIERVAFECDGNPLYIIETIKTLKNSRMIEMMEGEWKIVPGKRIEIPPP